MTGSCLREARRKKGWTQEDSARKLRVSQAYLSMLERDRRQVPDRLMQRLSKTFGLGPLALSFRGPETWKKVGATGLATQLASLGYSGFSYLAGTPAWNPAELLLAALTKEELESRVAEALPWLVLEYHSMDWDWVVREAKVHDVTNRLGFVVTLARVVAEQQGKQDVAEKLSSLESTLQRSLLAREDTFCNERMSQAERHWLREKRTPQARMWNVLSSLAPEHLSHAT